MSNQAINGVVDKCWTKSKSTRYGDKEIHYCEVDGVAFETGFKKVFSEGEMVNCAVKFQYGALQYQPGVDATGLPPAKAGGTVKKGNFSKSGGSNYGARGKFPIDVTDGQMSIIRQSSMDRAVTIVRDLVAVGLFKPKSEEDYLKKCIEIALTITDYASGQDIMKLSSAKAAAKEAING